MSDVRRSGGAASPTAATSNSHHIHTSPQLLKQLTAPPVVSASSVAANLAALVAAAASPTINVGGSQTPYVLTPSVSGRSSPSMSPSPVRKKLKLDVEAASAHQQQQLENNNSSSSSSPKSSRRKRLCHRRQTRLDKISGKYKDSLAELFHIQSDGSNFDLPLLRRKPTHQFLNFLSANNAPARIIEEVTAHVMGPAAAAAAAAALSSSSEPASPSPMQTPRAVTSAAMAAAVAAAAAAAGSPLIRSTSTSLPTPYSPRAALMSPVRVGDRLQSLASIDSSRRVLWPSSVTSAAAPSTSQFREQLSEKIKQEAWVIHRVGELTKEGLWTEKRLPKVCERPRPRSHWDVLLQEMRWLAVDFHQEREWKRAAAKMLAESAKEYVKTMEHRRQKTREAKERRMRRIAGFMANEVMSFWDEAATEAIIVSADAVGDDDSDTFVNSRLHNNNHHEQEAHSEEKPSVSAVHKSESFLKSKVVTSLIDPSRHERRLPSGYSCKRSRLLNHLNCNQIEDLLNESDDKDYSYEEFLPSDAEDDEESTIADQEAYESEHTIPDARFELDTLNADNLKSIDTILRSEYPGYIPQADEEVEKPVGINHLDSDESLSSSGSDDDDEEEDFCLEDVEKVLYLPMLPAQKKLYDDFLAGPETRTALETGDSVSIANVVRSLRKICNYPQLAASIEDEADSKSQRFDGDTIPSFPRTADLTEVSKLVLTATDYNPYKQVDFGSLNMVFLQHETTLTAITFDRIRKCCAPKTLIEELPDRPAPPPTVPRGRLTIDIQSSGTSASQASSASGRPQLGISRPPILLASSPVADSEDSDHAAGPLQPPQTAAVAEAFHKDSLHVIARFNERRCMGMPLYGQDLLNALTVVDAIRPPSKTYRTRQRGQGYVNCLSAMSDSWVDLGSGHYLDSPARMTPPLLRLPWTSMSLGSSGRSRSTEKRVEYRFKTLALKQMVQVIQQQIKIHTDLVRVFSCFSPPVLVPSTNRSVRLLQDRLQPSLSLVQQHECVLRKSGLLESASPINTLGARSELLQVKMSVKLEKLDALLRRFRRCGERVLVFCQMPEMLDVLRQFFNARHFPFTYLENDASLSKRATRLQWFAERHNILVLLTSTMTPVSGLSLPPIDNVIFFDANWNSNSEVSLSSGSLKQASLAVSPCLQWCRQLRGRRHQLKIYRLVCENTLEDSISVKALQERLLGDIKIIRQSTPENGSSMPTFTIKRQTLEALLGPHVGDNGITGINNDRVKNEKLPEDVESMAYLDFLWSNQMWKKLHYEKSSSSAMDVDTMSVTELAKQLDKDVFDGHFKSFGNLESSKPVKRFAVQWMNTLLEEDPSLLEEDFDDIIDPMSFYDENDAKRDWEHRFQIDLDEAAAEMAKLETLPCLTYSSEDAGRTWHGRDGQPMPLWTPPTPSSMTSVDSADVVDHHLSFLYKTRLMEESELPPVYVKKDDPMTSSSLLAGTSGSNKRSALDGDSTGDYKKFRKDDHMVGNLTASGGFAPRSLFERPQAVLPKATKIRNRLPNRHLPPGVGSMPPGLPGTMVPPTSATPAGALPGGISPVAGLRHPLPRPQVEVENLPEWLVQEDWALLHAIRDLQELPINLVAASPAHTPNWDLVSDMVNSVSRCYRGPKQCRNRYETIILPREEGRIFDMPPSAVAAMAAQAAAAQAALNKKSKKKQTPAVKLAAANTRPLKTSALFAQDNNTAWSSMFALRFETIKSVANKRSPTTKPLVVNPAMKNSQHAAVLAESGINYDSPLNPIQVAANRAERIQREKQRQQVEQQQQLAQQRTAAAQAAAAQATASAAQQQQTRLVTATITTPQHPLAGQQSQQQQQQVQAVVSSSPHPPAVVVGISHPMTTVNSAQINNVIQSRLQQQQQQQQQVVQQQQTATAVQQIRTAPQPQTIGIQELVRVSQQQHQHSTVVVTSQPSSTVVSVASLTPSQLQAAQKLVTHANAMKGGVVTAQGRPLTSQQVTMLRQQALQKKNAQDNAAAAVAAQAKARIQGMQIATAGTSTSGAATGTGQTLATVSSSSGSVMTPHKVTVTNVSLAPSSLVTVVTQTGQNKTFIRQVSGAQVGKGTTNIRTMTEADMKMLLASKQQQLQTINAKGQVLQVPAQSNLAAQLLASGGSIHVQQSGAGGHQVATLVKTVTAGNNSGVAVVGASGQAQPSVTIPVASVNLQQVKAALNRPGITNTPQMLAVRHQILQQQQRKPGTATLASGSAPQHKVTLGQVTAKGVPAQLIVSPSGAMTATAASGQKQLTQAVTVQQYQQIVKSVQQGSSGVQQQSGQQQLMPHAVFTKQAVMSTIGAGGTVSGLITTVGGAIGTTQTSTVQARVIPVSSTAAGRMQQISVVTASPAQVQAAAAAGGARQLTAAPNVTVDASGRTTFGSPAGGQQQIRVTTSAGQQYLTTASGQNVSLAVRAPVGVITSHHPQQIIASHQQLTGGITKLQVVGPSTSSAASTASSTTAPTTSSSASQP